MSLSQSSGYGLEGEGLAAFNHNATKRIWLKVMSGATTAPKLELPENNYAPISNNVGGSTVADSGITGGVVEVIPVTGSTDADSAISGDATVVGVGAPVAGEVLSGSSEEGAVKVVAPVAGAASSAASVTGAANIGTPAATTTKHYITGWSGQSQLTPPTRTLLGTVTDVAAVALGACTAISTRMDDYFAHPPAGFDPVDTAFLGQFAGTFSAGVSRYHWGLVSPIAGLTGNSAGDAVVSPAIAGKPFTFHYDCYYWYDEPSDTVGVDFYIGPDTWIEY
jgi:hypothetical protein